MCTLSACCVVYTKFSGSTSDRLFDFVSVMFILKENIHVQCMQFRGFCSTLSTI